MNGLEIVHFGSPARTPSGRIDLLWAGPQTKIVVNLIVRPAGGQSSIRAEISTNAAQPSDANRWDVSPMVLVLAAHGLLCFRAELNLAKLGTSRFFARVVTGDGTVVTTRQLGWADLLVRPRPRRCDELTIETVAVANVNCRSAAAPGTLADLLEAGSPSTTGFYTLEWLAEMGKNCICLLPVLPPTRQSRVYADEDSGSPYAPEHFFSLRPELARSARGLAGAKAAAAARVEFRQVLERAHALGIAVVLDIPLNHLGRGHVFADLFEREHDGQRVREVRCNDFSQIAPDAMWLAQVEQRLADEVTPKYLEHLAPTLFASHRRFPAGAQNAKEIAPGGWFEWPDALQLNHGRRRLSFHEFVEGEPTAEQRAVQAWLQRVLTYWAVEVGVDGFRIDHMAGLPRRFLEHGLNAVQAAVNEDRPNEALILIGEDYDTTHETQHFVDAVQAGWFGQVMQSADPGRIREALSSPWFHHLLALSSHDEDRPHKLCGGDDSRTLSSGLLPYFLGGSLLEVAGDSRGERERIEVRRHRPLAAMLSSDERTRRFEQAFRRAGALRREEPALGGARRIWLRQLDGSDHPAILAFARHGEDGGDATLWVFFNTSGEHREAGLFALDRLSAARLDQGAQYQVDDLLESAAEEPLWPETRLGSAIIDQGVHVSLAPMQLQVLRLTRVGHSTTRVRRRAGQPGPAPSECSSAAAPWACDGAREISFIHTAPAGRRVELVGDFPEWKRPLAMTEELPGRYSRTVRLERGLYRYKFRIDGQSFVCDPHAAATEHDGPHHNALCLVGGCTYPLRFTAGVQQVRFDAQGYLWLHAEGPTSALPRWAWLHWLEERGGGQQRSAMPLLWLPMAGEDRWTRAFARSPEPLESPPTHLSFDAEGEALIDLPGPATPRPAPPPTVRGTVLYAIFVDRWLRGRSSPADQSLSARHLPSQAERFYGGDLAGLREHLDYIAALGVDGLVLTPLHASPTPHRYDSTDLMTLDPRLGDDRELAALIAAAHARNLSIILDLSITHVHQTHPAFADLLARQERSTFAPWFRVKRFPVGAGDEASVMLYPTRPELPLLNLEPGPARDHVLAVVDRWVATGIDGLRLDAMNDAPADFWLELRQRARAQRPDLLLLGEVVIDRPHLFADERGVDIATDFGHRELMVDFFARDRLDAAEFWQRLQRSRFDQGPLSDQFHLAFLDNHDTARFATLAGDFARLRLALAYLLFRPEPVWLTYGTELGLGSGRAPGQLDDVWPERMPMPEARLGPRLTQRLVRQLLRLRRVYEAWRQGDVRLLEARGRLLLLERTTARSRLVGVFNAGASAVEVGAAPEGLTLIFASHEPLGRPGSTLPPHGVRIFAPAGEVIEAYSLLEPLGDETADRPVSGAHPSAPTRPTRASGPPVEGEEPGQLLATLLPWALPSAGSAQEARRWDGHERDDTPMPANGGPGSEPAPARRSRTQEDLRAADTEFRAGLIEGRAPPTRFYVNLTERCCLRCRHCITDAPEKTRDGTGRVMEREVIDALAPALKHAAYVGFAHAGEPLFAPELDYFLARLRAARGSEPTVVHLLTNGELLDRARFVELVRAGVNSWSFSVDGMTQTTHDALRVGSQIETLGARIADLSQLRHAWPTAPRLGIAWTVSRANVAELPDLIRFAGAARLDWVKLEEMFPSNASAAELVYEPASAMREAVEQAQRLGRAAGVELLDHTRAPAVFKCLLGDDPDLREFSRLDDFVNRMEINPCRLPWELVCVEPNGEVKAVSFLAEVAGNLLSTSWAELVRSPAFGRARRAAINQRVCRGTPTCGGDPGPERW